MIVTIIAIMLVSNVSMTGATAGTGTPTDPWHNLDLFYDFVNPNAPSKSYQDITATLAHTSFVEFWAYQVSLTYNGLQYAGFQTQGRLKGNRNGQLVAKSVAFSMQDIPGYPLHDLQPQYCSTGFDQYVGLSCAQELNWSVGATYRIAMNYSYGITTPGWCPAGVSVCTVASGFFGIVQIAAFSYSPYNFGGVQSAAAFLELPAGGTCTAPIPSGQFAVPFKVVGGVSTSVTSAYSFDRNPPITTPPGSCARTYIDGLVQRIHY